MSNSYFKFKQFIIQQDKCAMKVCTDACLFGAITARLPQTADNCLDIGTGTGLLALMIAQQNPGMMIDAVEIDALAAEQATENFSASPWADRLRVINTDIQSYKTSKKYSLIISNPPFFEDDLHSPDVKKNHAKHDTALSLAELLKAVKDNLVADGIFSVLLPYRRVDDFIDVASAEGLFLSKQILVNQTKNHHYFRGILFFTFEKTDAQISSMSIKDNEGNYTTEFINVLRDYYLFL